MTREQVILDRISKLTKVLQKTEMFQTDPVAQKLNAKFTGLLGKISSYVNQNSPAPEVNAKAPEQLEPTRPQAPQGQKVAAASESIQENRLRELIRKIIVTELTEPEKQEKLANLEKEIADIQGKITQITIDAAKAKQPLEKQKAALQKEKDKVSKMAVD